ncbi:MAG: hypothetical protein AAF251_07080 [Pseudomonadota bacterium]
MDEDFALDERIQAEQSKDTIIELAFPRFESALAAFNQIVADMIASTH